jgi:hypothetical protein
MPDRAAVIREVARVLRPGARFVFTTWEAGESSDAAPRFRVAHEPLLRAAGFRVDERRLEPEWIVRARAFFGAVLERREKIAAECGPISEAFFGEAKRILAEERSPPRVLYAATRVSQLTN